MGGGGRVFTPKYNVLVHCTYLRKKYYIFKRVFSVRKGDLKWLKPVEKYNMFYINEIREEMSNAGISI